MQLEWLEVQFQDMAEIRVVSRFVRFSSAIAGLDKPDLLLSGQQSYRPWKV